jgi:hypothetical protein
MYGGWQTTPAQYVSEARRYADEVGGLEWAAIQDWMCEPQIRAKTRASVRDHQNRTIRSYLDLRAMAPDIPWIPVLQGWKSVDYLRHIDLYAAAGVGLSDLPRVGLGSICRRQGDTEIAELVRVLEPLRLHGFGVKASGLRLVGRGFVSCDSMAWSYAARRRGKQAECDHATCSNCFRFALAWREEILAIIRKGSDVERVAAG